MDRNSLRSLHSVVRSYVLFHNASRCRARVYWMNYEGDRVLYRTLARGESMSVDTFVSHPWTFENADTGDSLGAMGRPVFYPRDPKHPNYRPFRTVVAITYPLYSLRQRCLQTIRDCLSNPEEVDDLELPRSLQKELRELMRKRMFCTAHSFRHLGEGES
ncbi:hypothetical protein AAG570_002965 [Ranatra chinensis]|uniref:SOCS box domain-containing protein n=1 Tax=Ranatra chinensis TaxID=642074 RepID=A0ABD0YNC8_9HEMI